MSGTWKSDDGLLVKVESYVEIELKILRRRPIRIMPRATGVFFYFHVNCFHGERSYKAQEHKKQETLKKAKKPSKCEGPGTTDDCRDPGKEVKECCLLTSSP